MEEQGNKQKLVLYGGINSIENRDNKLFIMTLYEQNLIF